MLIQGTVDTDYEYLLGSFMSDGHVANLLTVLDTSLECELKLP